MAVNYAHYRRQIAQIQALAQALVKRNTPLFGINSSGHYGFIGSLGGPHMAPNTGAKSSGGAKKAEGSGKPSASAKAAERIASMHAEARAWQTAHPDAPEAKPGEKLTPNTQIIPDRINPYAVEKGADMRPSIEALREGFGDRQLGLALYAYSPELLTKIATDLGISTAGIANNHDALVSAITHHVTGGHYSADFGTPAKASATKLAADPERQARLAKLRADIEALQAKHAALAGHPAMGHLEKARKATEAKVGAAKAKGSKSKPSALTDGLKPISTIKGIDFDITKPADAIMLRTLYGDKQLHAALNRYTLKQLQEGARAHSATIPIRASKEKQIEELVAWAKTQPLMLHTPL